MLCPSCKKSQPMSFRCKSCGAELVKRFASGGARSSRNAGGAAAAAVAMESPMDMPAMAQAAAGRSYAGDTPLASRGSRFGAALLDVLFWGLSIVPGVLILSTMGGSDGMGSIGLLGFIIGPAILAVYTIHILIRDGQTLGKKAMKIRIVNYDDGGNPGFNRVIVMRGIVNGILSSIPFYAFVDVLFIFGSEQRCLHDLIAKTKVVQAAG